MTLVRRHGRGAAELRPVSLDFGAAPYAEGSCLIRMGSTAVLCTATVEETTPGWMKGTGKGWVTAEYAMLPRATHTRTARERGNLGGRTQEIQRLIGRSLRACMDMSLLGERTIRVDCDVLQADGGTRTASITGGAIALRQACEWLQTNRGLPESPFRQSVAALSVGIVNGTVLLDLDYSEDSIAAVDLNIVAVESGELVEVQGTAERSPFTSAELVEMIAVGSEGLRKLFELNSGAA
jgi:ribonuclease PH